MRALLDGVTDATTATYNLTANVVATSYNLTVDTTAAAYNLVFLPFHATPSPTEEKNNKLIITQDMYLNKLINVQTYHDYLSNPELMTEGYTEIILNGFNFLKDTEKGELCLLLDILQGSELFTLKNATLSCAQIKELVSNDYDLSTCTYQTPAAISTEEYFEFYLFCRKKNLLKSLHSVSVDFSDQNLWIYPTDFASVCKPIFNRTTLSPTQLDSLLETKKAIELNLSLVTKAEKKHYQHSLIKQARPLNLSGVQAPKINILYLLNNFKERISFEKPPEIDLSSTLYLSPTSIQYQPIDFSTLCSLAPFQRLHILFFKENLTFMIQIEDGLEIHDVEINVDAFTLELTKVEMAPLSARNASFQFEPPKQSQNNQEEQPRKSAIFFQQLKNELTKHNKSHQNLNFESMHNGSKLLWIFHCCAVRPNSFLALTLNTKLKQMKTYNQALI